MKRLTRTLPLLLATALQLLPLLRNIVTLPSAGSSFAFILRWGLGSTAAFGAYDAFSAASTPYFTPLQTNINLVVGTYYTNNIIVTNTQDGSLAYFDLFKTNTTTDSGQFTNLQSTTVSLPPGLKATFFDHSKINLELILAIYGTPTTPAATYGITVDAGYSGNGDIYTNIFFTVAAGGGSPPVITNQPVSVATDVGNNVTLSVVDGGTAPFKYQWYFNTNTPLLNATNVSLTLTNVQLTNSGYYRVAITNSVGSTNSANALLTVWQPPVITNQPMSFTNVAGGNATFGVVAGGVPSPAYQWKLNTSTILTNATGVSLTLTNLRASQAGTYSVTITNAGGATNSFQATLVVTNPLPTTITAPAKSGGLFSFTFIPVVGLTNSVLTNGVLTGGVWSVLTNVPPPVSASPVTVTDSLGTSNRFYRVQIVP